MIPVIVLLVVAGLLVVFIISMYNRLVQARNQVKNAWSQIDVQLKRRHDLIPNLIETVKGYMTHERELLENITKARSRAMQAESVGERSQAESELSGAMGQFYVVVENYPDLKANENFLSLQEELTSTENRIGFARQYYNDEVMKYNNRIQMFPSNVIAGMFNFKQEDFFEIEDPGEREVPKVAF